MRYRLPALFLLVVLPGMYPQAAPAPEKPYAILDIGPPPQGKTDEEHRKDLIAGLKHPHGGVGHIWGLAEARNVLPPDIKGYPAQWQWLAEKLIIKWDGEGHCLRLIFQAGNRADQVAILNTLLRVYMREAVEMEIQGIEQSIRGIESREALAIQLLKQQWDPKQIAHLRKGMEDAKARVANYRATLSRLKQVAVIKWAK